MVQQLSLFREYEQNGMEIRKHLELNGQKL